MSDVNRLASTIALCAALLLIAVLNGFGLVAARLDNLNSESNGRHLIEAEGHTWLVFQGNSWHWKECPCGHGDKCPWQIQQATPAAIEQPAGHNLITQRDSDG